MPKTIKEFPRFIMCKNISLNNSINVDVVLCKHAFETAALMGMSDFR